MAPDAAPKTVEDYLGLLQVACDRNIATDVQIETETGRVTARMRLLDCQEDCIIVDQPHRIGLPIHFRRNQMINVFFHIDTNRYCFRTRVQSPIMLYDLNPTVKVLGAALRIPGSVEIQQRRNTFRISLSARDFYAKVHRVELKPNLVCPGDAKCLHAKITDISSGGMGILIPHKLGKYIQKEEFYFLMYKLHTNDNLSQIAQVKQFRQIRSSKDYRVGLEFAEDWHLDDAKTMDTVRAFLMDEQRRQLRLQKT